MAEDRIDRRTGNLPQVAVVDDDPFVLKMWSLSNPDIRLHTFLSPKAFWATMGSDPDLLASLDCVITDHFFEADDSMIDGAEFARELKKVFRQPVILNSNLLFGPAELSEVFDFQIENKTSSWGDILALLQ